MHRYMPAFFGLIFAIVLGYGLVHVIKKNLHAAPRAEIGQAGRLHPHFKNVTRFEGDEEDVRKDVWRAVYLDGAPPEKKSDWKMEALSHVEIRKTAGHVIVLPEAGDEAMLWALPGLYWAAWSGSPVFFSEKDGISAETLSEIKRLGLPAYVLAPENNVSQKVLHSIGEQVPVKRVSGRTPADHAVKIAEYRDPSTNFGWGRTHDEREGYFHFVVTGIAEPEYALAALPLAWSNGAALLYSGGRGEITPELDRYAWKQKTDFFVTPSEGPFRHFFVVGNATTYAAQARLDLAVEKGPYPSKGPAALGPLEGLSIVFIALGLAGAVIVLVHGWAVLKRVQTGPRIAWVYTSLLLPVLGPLLYFSAYRKQASTDGGMASFVRPPSMQAASATAVSFGYGAPLMIAIGYFFVALGFPLWFGEWASGWQFLFGAGMPQMMFWMWAGAILIAWPLIQMPMQIKMNPGMPKGRLAVKTLLITALSMTSVSLGMMTMAWIMMMIKLPMMPQDDEVLWFGSMWLASAIGFFIAWPLNYLMVRSGLKHGGM